MEPKKIENTKQQPENDSISYYPPILKRQIAGIPKKPTNEELRLSYKEAESTWAERSALFQQRKFRTR